MLFDFCTKWRDKFLVFNANFIFYFTTYIFDCQLVLSQIENQIEPNWIKRFSLVYSLNSCLKSSKEPYFQFKVMGLLNQTKSIVEQCFSKFITQINDFMGKYVTQHWFSLFEWRFKNYHYWRNFANLSVLIFRWLSGLIS